MLHATITALAILENPQTLPNSSKTYVFDAQIYIGNPAQPSLVGYLHYFNHKNLNFPPTPTFYNIITTIVLMDKAVVIHSAPDCMLDTTDYDFVSDIQKITPRGPACSDNPEVDDTASTSSLTDAMAEDTSAINKSSFFKIDPQDHSYVHLWGHVCKSNDLTASFEIDVEPYMSAFRDIKASKPVFPVMCIIPDSPCYPGKKPIPYANQYISVDGHLTGFHIPAGTPASADKKPTPSPTSTPHSKKLAYKFQGSPSPAPVAKQHKLEHDSNSSLASITSSD
ncbi:hypothetical protein BDQ12DRAFT_725512 [Crucibulum laeve]|uniref:Uncharacterized protein n=1 Tax=Crucibulum laeve TaxID=68775 RepID=A0A5C3LVL3_9AGAR|nr:hypothetical protein BDQ12DRAFT_725512 [Crucibulum laeve]